MLDSQRQLPISIIMIDINGLKLVNDSYGHQKGDQIIRRTADLIKQTFRREDIYARWGGDEFIVFLPKTDEENALKMIKRLEDGSKNIEGESRIPLFSRIIHLLDAYDVMLSGRPYKKALTKEEAIKELKRNASLQFDPFLVKSLIEILK